MNQRDCLKTKGLKIYLKNGQTIGELFPFSIKKVIFSVSFRKLMLYKKVG